MIKLRNANARPRSEAASPAYPRLASVGLAFALAACGGQAVEDSPSGAAGAAGEGGEAGNGGQTAGGIAPPFDAGEVPEGGVAPPPFDGGEEDVEPPIAGDIAYPFDAGVDAWEETDADIGGGAPWPYDAGEEEDAGLSGAAPPPYDSGPW